MKTFICYVGILRPGLNKPISWLPKLRDRFSEAFAAGSSLTNGNSDFSIYLRFTRYKNYLIPHNESTQTYHLHKGLDRILGQQPLGWNLKELAVLYADEFTPRPGLFGIMFDTGFTGNLSNKRIPRQGCTVFLKPIMAVRTGEDLKKEIFFTTVHELGHVFNLWDRNYATPLSFMSTSDHFKIDTYKSVRLQNMCILEDQITANETVLVHLNLPIPICLERETSLLN